MKLRLSLLALALQALSGLPLTPDATVDEVVVIGRRLGIWHGTITSSPFGTRCHTVQSTGDPKIVAVGCMAMSACWPEARRGYRFTQTTRDPAERERVREGAESAFASCIKVQRLALIADLVSRGAIREGFAK